MKGDKPLKDFIKSNGIYKSTMKISGEMHAGCFMYNSTWKYIRFIDNQEYINIFESQFDLKHLKTLKSKFQDFNFPLNYKRFEMTKENWEDGTFSFTGCFQDNDNIKYTGNFRQNLYGEDELLIVNNENYAEIFEFIKFDHNIKLEYEILNLFSDNTYVKVNNGLPRFGYTDLEVSFVFDKLTNLKYIQPSGTHHLDCYDFLRTPEGDKYFNEIKANA